MMNAADRVNGSDAAVANRQSRLIGQIVATVITGWIILVVAGGLEPVGSHFVILGVLRIVLFAALVALAVKAGQRRSRFGVFGLGVAAVGAVANLAGGVGSVVTDGWDYNPFAPGAAESPPWYAFVIGISAFIFALGSILTGVAARSAGWPAVAAVLGGLLYPMAVVMQELYGHDPGDLVGHLIWIAPWLVLALGLSRTDSRRS
jgi:hypothetical protein